jgi:hypothetical protein
MKTAYATIKGFEVMRIIRKRQCICLNRRGAIRGRDLVCAAAPRSA